MSIMARSSALLALVMVCLVACAGSDAPPAATITPDELASRIEAGTAPLVLDVRSEQEYQAGHIPGAVLIPHDQLAGRIGELAGHEDDEIVVHCKSGRRAAMAEEVLRGAGFHDVKDLEGHMIAWQQGGYPTE